ncbi:MULTISPECIES: sirohydrochlorin chelatase [unclassified Staphylococcus]|uniref:sirohydrochlorin chelatase n=1 Tax=unclassified Staphylococcus TaxID=91994 RepID=UPI0021CF4954|nr:MULTISPECIES: sirohydrochlorin chelatase [unclassified Staphylococcus]UXR69400.1 sirohydrochlorin chelatase [Staphylococcus sp. IVB6246]UXR73734.1 sirohydrochlorin chelatase [Staphylococcus sp. IVB6238]UXR76052.1 sirohydrochlorin chelatase [Staphylococcus sp. IVB6233]UXR80250.1 sirohydrochlorin chelatase [Staphylococcus sp. IVB6218]
MQKTILIVHGMRKGKLNEILEQFVHDLFDHTSIDYDVAFLESEERSLETVVAATVRQGYQAVNLVPLLLFTASHYYEDIADQMKVWTDQYPQVQFMLAEPLGTHPAMTEWISKQLSRYEHEIDHTTGVVILAHGNARFDEPDVALTRLAKQHSNDQFQCYPSMVYGKLKFKNTLLPLAEQYDKLLIIPFFFYDGYLVNKTKRRISEMMLPTEIVYTTAINFDPVLKTIILARIASCEEARHVSNTAELV